MPKKQEKVPLYFITCLLEVCKFYIKGWDNSPKNMKKVRNVLIHHIISEHSTREILKGIEKLGIELPESHYSARNVVMCDDNCPADMRPVREIVELLADYMIKKATEKPKEEK
ncbi:Uncharacterised protein [uncultured archaeon]|nr:Uncharacterised protein [uncultured archaeon]